MNAKQRRVERRRVLRALTKLATKLGLQGWSMAWIRRDKTVYGKEHLFRTLWRRLEQVGGDPDQGGRKR